VSDQAKTMIAYILGVSVVFLAWSFLRTVELPLPVGGSAAVVTSQQSAGPPSVPVTRE
jgi:hypothetical protein